MNTKIFALRLAAVVFAFASASAHAGEADVIAATAKRNADGTYRIDATIKSRDTGWDYYAERFEVLTQDGKILATRVLAHPHEDEQPFTRELDNVKIPAGVTEIKVRA
jgi:peroxiredoxin